MLREPVEALNCQNRQLGGAQANTFDSIRSRGCPSTSPCAIVRREGSASQVLCLECSRFMHLCLPWAQGVRGSNPLAPTKISTLPNYSQAEMRDARFARQLPNGLC